MKNRGQHCDTCGAILPAPGFFCAQCGPPSAPDIDTENGLSFFQACLRITLLTLIFIAVVMVKLEIDPATLFQNQEVKEPPLKIAEDEDYKIFFKVNVSFANLRDEPDTTTSTILFVLPKGTQVEVLDKKEGWSKIRSKPKSGEQARTGWLASKLLDSEIK